MEAVFLKLLNMSITAGWIVLAVVLLRLLLRKAPKWISCLLWVLVGLRLVLPFSFESKVSVVPSTETIPQEIIYAQEPKPITDVIAADIAMSPVSADIFFPAPENSVDPIQIVVFIASIVWCIGAACMLLYALISYLRIKHKVRISAPLRDNIYICDNIGTPFILGVFKPKIYLPSDIGEEEAEYIIAHEKSHLKRLDHLWKPLGFALLTVYWFNPLLWLGYVLLCRDIELACDERVIKNMGAEEKKAYSTALLDCSIPRRMISACPLAFGEVNVKNRIKNVLNYKKPAFWIIVVAIVACVVASVCLLTDPKSKDGKADSVPEISLSDIVDMNIGTDLPHVIYCDDERVIMNGTFGLLVYNHNEAEIERRVSYDVLKEYGFTGIDAAASPDGKKVYICQHDEMSLNYTYQYDVEKNEISPCEEKPQSFFSKDSGDIVIIDDYLLNEDYSGYFNEYYINDCFGVHCTESGFYYLRSDVDWTMRSLQLVHHSYSLDNDTVYYIFDEIYFSIGGSYTYTVKENGTNYSGVYITLDQCNISSSAPNKFVTVTLHNDSDEIIDTGYFIHIFRYEYGNWIRCRNTADNVWGGEGSLIDPGATLTHDYLVNDYDMGCSGTYRFELVFYAERTVCEAWVEFELLWNKSAADGVTVSVKEQKLFSGLPYIAVEWKNETDECMLFREPFTLCHKEGDEWTDSSTKEVSCGATLYALPPHDTVVKKYYLSYHDLTKKEYCFTAEYFPDERPSETYTASVCFELEGIVDPMETSDCQATSVIYASSLLNSPDDLGVGTKYRAVTNDGSIALYQLNSVNEYDDIGVLKSTELTEKNFDFLFSESFKKSGLSAEKLRRENKRAFMQILEEESRLHMLLFQNDGSVYLVTGYSDRAERVYELTTPATASYEFGASGESEEMAVYYFRDSVDFMEPKIVLSPDSGGFEFVYSGLSSYIAWGSYILTEDTLMLPTSDGMYVYVFDVTDEGFIFDAERSSEIPEYHYRADEEAQCPVPDGALFEGDMIYPEPVAAVRSPDDYGKSLTLTKSSIPHTSDWKTAGLESAGLGKASFFSSTESSLGTLHILTHYTYSHVFTDIFFALEREEDILLYSVTELSFPEYLYFCDIDGDKTDEIVFMVDNGGNGGAGSHTTYVWKVTDEGFETLMALNGYVTYFDTGFEFELQTPFEMIVRNSYTGYSRIIDFSNRSGYIGSVYDEKGSPAVTWTAYHDCFYYIVPCDIDNDGVYEMECTAYTSLYGHSDSIGDSICTLRYDKKSGDFKVVDARFELYEHVAQEVGAEEFCTVSQNSDITYSCEIKDFEGKVIHTLEDIPKEPEVQRISDCVVKVSSQGGTGLSTRWTQYFNVLTGEKSDVFYYVLCEHNGKVISADFKDGKHRIIVQDIFDKDAFYKVCPIVVPCAAADFVKDVEMAYNGTAVITCVNSEGEEFLIAVDTTKETPLSEYYPFPLTPDEGEQVYKANEFYIVLDKDYTEYEYAVLDVNGNVLLKDHKLPRSTNFYMVNDSVLCVYKSGDGVYTSEAVYCNVYTGQLSPTYYVAFDEYGNNVIYVEYDEKTGSHSIIVRDFFDENVFYKKIPITSGFSAPVEAVREVYVSPSGMATVYFVKDLSNTEYEIYIDMTKE